METTSLTANEILSITEPEKLFRNPDNLRATMVDLSNQWHPDHNPSGNTVMAHITVLFSQAKKKVQEGTWEDPESIILSVDSKQKKFKYLRKHTFDLGRMYIGSKRIVILLTDEYDDVRINYSNIMKRFSWPNETLEKDIKNYLPDFTNVVTEKGERGFLITKDPKKLLLKDVNEHFKGKIPMPHILWMISRCMHLASWLEYSKIMYGGFSTENLFIDPEGHTLSLLGGWWYSHVVDTRLSVVSSEFMSIVPSRLLVDLKAKSIMDRYLIRRLAGELMGDPSGNNLTHNKDIPTSIEQWINMPPAKTAVEDYKNWYVALEAAYGKRKFTKFELTEKDIYGT